jgi:hypothetical protein
MAQYAIDTPDGRVAACGRCKTKAATRYLPSKKARTYCDTCWPKDSSLWNRLVRITQPIKLRADAVVLAPSKPQPKPKPQPTKVEPFDASPIGKMLDETLARQAEEVRELFRGYDDGMLMAASKTRELLTALGAKTIEDATTTATTQAELIVEQKTHIRSLESRIAQLRADLEYAKGMEREAIEENARLSARLKGAPAYASH